MDCGLGGAVNVEVRDHRSCGGGGWWRAGRTQRDVHRDSVKVMEAAEFRLLVVLKRWDDQNPESAS